MLNFKTRLELVFLGLGITVLGLQIQEAIAYPVNSYNRPQPADVIINSDPQAYPLPSQPGQVNYPPQTSSIDPRFTCQNNNGQYTVMYRPLSQPGRAYPWAVPRNLGDGWTAQRRCQEISQRLESYRPDGLAELQTGYENGYQTICATTETVPGCRIVLTVPPGQDAEVIRDRVFQSLTVADSGQMTQGVNAFTGGNSGQNFFNQLGQLFNFGQSKTNPKAIATNPSEGINLRPFLDTADGGTGQQLSRLPSKKSSQRLNSGQFR